MWVHPVLADAERIWSEPHLERIKKKTQNSFSSFMSICKYKNSSSQHKKEVAGADINRSLFHSADVTALNTNTLRKGIVVDMDHEGSRQKNKKQLERTASTLF